MNCPWRGVFGNNDGEREGLSKISQGRIVEPPLFLEFDSKRIALTHKFIDLEADVIVSGHTHISKVEKRDSTLIVNPGEASGWLYGKATVGILDTRTVSVEFFPL